MRLRRSVKLRHRTSKSINAKRPLVQSGRRLRRNVIVKYTNFCKHSVIYPLLRDNGLTFCLEGYSLNAKGRSMNLANPTLTAKRGGPYVSQTCMVSFHDE